MSDDPRNDAPAQSIEELSAALAETQGSTRCDRCRRAAGVLRLDLRVRPTRRPEGMSSGTAPATLKVLANLCDPCAAAVASVVARAVGKVP